jgi:uncharacterized protein
MAQLGARLKLHVQASTNSNTVTGYGHDYVEINRIRHVDPLILAGEGPVRAWRAAGFESLRAEDFAAVLELEPELVLIGTGARQRFPAAALLRPFIDGGVGFEVMDTAAACRTYNILMGEGRHVVAALLLPGDGS